MAGLEESRYAALRLSSNAQRLLDDSANQRIVEFGITTIQFSKVGLRNGNITSIIGLSGSPGNLYKDSTWDLKNPPIDPPDIKEMNRLADILAIFL